MSAKIIESIVKNARAFLIGSPQSIMLLNRVTSLADGKKEQGNGYWIQKDSMAELTKEGRSFSARACLGEARP